MPTYNAKITGSQARAEAPLTRKEQREHSQESDTTENTRKHKFWQSFGKPLTKIGAPIIAGGGVVLLIVLSIIGGNTSEKLGTTVDAMPTVSTWSQIVDLQSKTTESIDVRYKKNENDKGDLCTIDYNGSAAESVRSVKITCDNTSLSFRDRNGASTKIGYKNSSAAFVKSQSGALKE